MISNEYRLILLFAQLQPSENEIKEMLEAFDERLDWGQFLFQAAHHRVIPLIWDNICKLELVSKMDKYVRHIFESETRRVIKHNQAVYKEARKINQEFNNHEIKAVTLKGAVLAPTIYGNIGLREFHDVDYLVDEAELTKVTHILGNLDFSQGLIDVNKNTITPVSKQEKIKHRMYTHEMVAFLKLTDDEYCKVIDIDINFEISWRGTRHTPVPALGTRDFLNHTVKVELEEISTYSLTPEYQLIHLCAHLYSEAVYFCFEDRWYRDKHDLQLIKFCDIHELLRQEKVDFRKLYSIVQHTELTVPMFYSLSLLDRLYPGKVDKEFLRDLNVNTKVLDIYYDQQGNEWTWKTDFETRMFDTRIKVEEVRMNNII
jgi:hypothetical protein